MKLKKYIKSILSLALLSLVLFSACEKEAVAPDLVPIKAEIKQVIVKNSTYRIGNINNVPDDIDTILVTVPQGTDITTLDLDILVSYFGSFEPAAGVTDLTNPVIYTVTTNVESRDVMLMAQVLPPALSSFILTSPFQVIGKIEEDKVILEVMEGTDLSAVSFIAEYFGETIEPDESRSLDLTVENPTIKVINKDFETVYDIQVDFFSEIVFTGKILDGTQLPQDFYPSLDPANAPAWTQIEDGSAYKGQALRFKSIDPDYGQAKFEYGNMELNPNAEETTTVFRVKGVDNGPDVHFLEMQFKVEGLRAKFYLYNDGIRLQGSDGKIDLDYADIGITDPLDWVTYRVTVNKVTSEVKLYVNEDPSPAIINTLMGTDGAGAVYIGDGGGKTYESIIDYFAFEADGAYSPEDLPLSEILEE